MNIHKGSSHEPHPKPLNIDLEAQNNIESPMAPTQKSQISKDVSRSSVNPFMIDLILIKIFGYVKRKDLPVCRLVCTKWNLMIIPRFREEFEIYVCTVEHSEPLTYNYISGTPEDCKPGENHKSMERFTQLMSTSVCIPFTKFRLYLNYKSKGRADFFKICGPVLTHLTLGSESFTWDRVFETGPECVLIENLKELFQHSENLEYLRFNTPIYHNEKDEGVKLFDGPAQNLSKLKYLSFSGYSWPDGKFPTHIYDLITHSPNLVDVTLTPPKLVLFSCGDNTDFLTPLVSPDRVRTLQNVTIEAHRISQGFVDQVEQRGVKLKKLCITGRDSDLADPQHMYRLMELQKDHLYEFDWSHDNWSSVREEPEFPRMKNLKVLIVQSHSMERTKQPFCEKFSNVELMSYVLRGDMRLDFLGSQSCPKMKSMELAFCRMDLPGFQRMTEVYSSSALTSLTLTSGYYSNPEFLKLLPLIWTNLTKLQELKLVFSVKNFQGNADSIFTGISAEDCETINENPCYWDFMNTEGKNKKLRELTSELCVSPSIADLKSLRRLSLKFPRIGLTDVTGYFGLYGLENIKHIHIDFCEFSKTCCESLLSQLSLESWVFREKHPLCVPEKDKEDTVNNEDDDFYLVLGHSFDYHGPNPDIVPPYFYPYKDKEDYSFY